MAADTPPIWSDGRRRVVVFLGKVAAFYGIWYVLYDLWLLPDGTLDRWLSLNVAWVSASLLEGMGLAPFFEGRVLGLPGALGVRIANGCNGLSTLGLFVGFVLAYPGSAVRRALFLPLGILAVYATNVARVIAMVVVQKHWPAAFDPLHGFGLTTIFYVVVFALWVLWAHYGQPASAPPADAAGGEPTPATAPS